MTMTETGSGDRITMVPTMYKVRCKTKNVVKEVPLSSPAMECCPICGGTRNECHFIYSTLPITA